MLSFQNVEMTSDMFKKYELVFFCFVFFFYVGGKIAMFLIYRGKHEKILPLPHETGRHSSMFTSHCEPLNPAWQLQVKPLTWSAQVPCKINLDVSD